MAIAAGNQIDQRAAAENMLTSATRSLFAVAEAYPVLKADGNMRILQEELSSTENRIAYARQFYNDAVMEYNTNCETFPGILTASMFGFHQELSFQEEADNGLENCLLTNFRISTAFIECSSLRPSARLDG